VVASNFLKEVSVEGIIANVMKLNPWDTHPSKMEEELWILLGTPLAKETQRHQVDIDSLAPF